MNFTFTEHISDPKQNVYAFSFTGVGAGYIVISDIIIEIRTVDTLDWKIYSDKVTLESVNSIIMPIEDVPETPADGLPNLRIRRVMPKDMPYAIWDSGQNFTDVEINNSFLQQLYTMHEVLDGFIGVFNVNINMQGYHITGVEVDWDDPKSVANVEAMLEAIEISGDATDKAEKYANSAMKWAVLMGEMVDDGINSKDYSSKKYAYDSKDSSISSKNSSDLSEDSSISSEKSNVESGNSATESGKQAALASEYEKEMSQIYLNVRSDFPSGYPVGAWMLHDGTLALEGSYNYIGRQLDVNNGWVKAVQDNVDLYSYMRNDMTDGDTQLIPDSRWYGNMGVGMPIMCTPASYGVPVEGYHSMIKIGARNQNKGSSWLHTPYDITKGGNAYFGTSPDYNEDVSWIKMLHEGCDTLVNQLPNNAGQLEGNLNDVKSPCFRSQYLDSYALLELNYPFTYAGSLAVVSTAGVLQTYTQYNSPFKVAKRVYYNNNWSDWVIDDPSRDRVKFTDKVYHIDVPLNANSNKLFSMKLDMAVGTQYSVQINITDPLSTGGQHTISWEINNRSDTEVLTKQEVGGFNSIFLFDRGRAGSKGVTISLYSYASQSGTTVKGIKVQVLVTEYVNRTYTVKANSYLNTHTHSGFTDSIINEMGVSNDKRHSKHT